MNKTKLDTTIKSNLQSIIILYFFIVISLPPLINIQLIYWSSIILIVVALFINLFFIKHLNKNYLIWIISINVFSFVSILWSSNTVYGINGVKSLMVASVTMIYIYIMTQRKGNIYSVMRLFIFSKLIMCIYILINIEATSLGNIRIGAGTLGEEWNANTIGMNVAITSIMIIVLIKETKFKISKIYYILALAMFIIISLLSGSKKALFILIFGISFYSILSSKRYKYTKSIIILSLSTLIMYIIMNTPWFYEVLGSRIESLLAQITGTGEIDRSTQLRITMIEQGIIYFKNQPLFGYGLNNYREVFGIHTGLFEYAHNNYIELLVGVGLIGTILFYFGHLLILKKSFLKKSNLLAFAFVSIICILILDVGLVSYGSFYIHLLICLSFSIINLPQENIKLNDKENI